MHFLAIYTNSNPGNAAIKNTPKKISINVNYIGDGKRKEMPKVNRPKYPGSAAKPRKKKQLKYLCCKSN